MQGACCNRLPKLVSQSDHFFDLSFDMLIIKIRVCNRHEKAAQDFIIHLIEIMNISLSVYNNIRDAFQGINQKVLKLCDLLILPANTFNCAAFVFRCLLTLITKHAHCFSSLIPFIIWRWFYQSQLPPSVRHHPGSIDF